MLCLCAALLTFQFQTDLGWTAKFNQLLHIGKTVALTFLAMVTRWSHSTFTFYVLIGQNLTDEFMRKFRAAS